MTHPPSDFRKYISTPFQSYILPIIPKGARLKADSKISQDQLGKIPGKYFPAVGEWGGFYAWPANRTTSTALAHWQVWQKPTPDGCGVSIAIAIRTKVILAVDIDADDEEVANELELRVVCWLGPPGAIRRRHGSPRRVLFYGHNVRTMPVTKMRLEFKILATDQKAAIEILGDGQQVVIEGPHAKGAMHYWQDGIGLIEGFGTMSGNLKTVDHFDQLMLHLKQWVEEDDRFQRVTMKLPTHGERDEAISISDLMSPHAAKDKDLLARAIAKIDINSPKLASYDRWIALFRAMKAACAGDDAFYAEHILPWLMKHPDNADGGVEKMESHWHSFTTSSIGADHVYQVAASFGFTEGLPNAQDIFAGRPLPADTAQASATPAERESTDQGSPASSDSSGAAGAAGAGSASGGPPPGPIPPSDTNRAIACSFTDQIAITRWRWNPDRKLWYSYDEARGIWRVDETLVSQLGAYMSAEARGILATPGAQATQRARNLESAGAIFAVERLLRTMPELLVFERDFDAQPHLLNTPSWVVDLKTGRFHPHAPEYLMRQQTLVDPNLEAWVPPEVLMDDEKPANIARLVEHMQRWMPRLLKTFQNIDGTNHKDGRRDWVIPTMGGVYGYILIGEIRHAGIFFLEGEPGLGKTQVWEVPYHILATYAAQINADFISKNGVGHRFDLSTIIGKRMLFLDETWMGMTYDEARMSNIGSGSKLTCEIKFGREAVDFVNRAKLCISGNH